ncbi:MAG: hypothetical protein H6728_00475 [Myxococcales bacterium]|nr:hypothetical protein [Myxococcales bacterium]MCB9641538.1 hypothetical protein [Myxococcales bacterium]
MSQDAVPTEGMELLSSEQRTFLERSLCGQQTLEEVLRWALGCQPACQLVEVIVQDEYTHDVVFSWGETIHLVFDTT